MSYPMNSCENIQNKGSLRCSADVQVTCGSLYPGHYQDCPVADAKGGWLQCLDLTEQTIGSFGCPEESYGIHKDNVWVQNGCQGNFYTCYIPDQPQGPVQERTIECRNYENSYKQCKIDGAYLVKSVTLKIKFDPKLPCHEGINYGIVSDSIFIKDGCNGIFKVEFFPESAAPPNLPVQTTRTTTTSTPRQATTTATTKLGTTINPELPTISSTTTGSTTTNQTSVLYPTHSQPSGSLIVLTAAAVLGIFLVLFLAILAIMWFSRRYRCTKRYLERKPDGTETTEGPSVGKLLPLKFNKGNIYEEISTHEEVPSAPPVYERQPFITNEFSGHDCSLEPNNNPKNPLGENYFILDPKYRDCQTLPRNPSRNACMNNTNFEPEIFHSNPPDHRQCQIHHPVARMGTLSNHVSHGHEPVIRMGTFNPKIHQYPLTLGPCINPHVMHNKQNTLPVLNGQSMRISDSDVDEDGYQKIGTFGPQQKHFQNHTPHFSSVPNALPNFRNVPNVQPPFNMVSNIPNFTNVPNFHSCVSEHCQNDPNQVFFDTSSC